MQSKIIEISDKWLSYSVEKVYLTYFLYSLLSPGDKRTLHFERTDVERQLGQSQLQLDLCLKYYKTLICYYYVLQPLLVFERLKCFLKKLNAT